jgi:hypothetical protein
VTNFRLLPWAAISAIVLGLAAGAVLPGKRLPPTEMVPGTGEAGPEIHLGPVTVREYHDDGEWNLLVADGAIYSYSRKTVKATGVVVSLGEGETLKGAVIRAPEAFWDFDGRTVALPEGGHADRQGGWTGDLSAGTLDLAGRILRVPGYASVAGPGFTVAGTNLEWRWWEGIITMDSPKSRIAPSMLPGRKG